MNAVACEAIKALSGVYQATRINVEQLQARLAEAIAFAPRSAWKLDESDPNAFGERESSPLITKSGSPEEASLPTMTPNGSDQPFLDLRDRASPS